MACGIIGGLCNEDMIRSVLSGVAGVFFGLLIFPPHFGLYVFGGYITHDTFGYLLWGWFPIGYFVILSILFGGLGGLIGNQIRVKLLKKTKATDIKNNSITLD